MTSNVRRSGRQRQPNKKYPDYLHERETLRILRESSQSSRPTSPDTADPQQITLDDDFDTINANEAQVTGDNEDEASLESDSPGAISDASSTREMSDCDDNFSVANSKASQPERQSDVFRIPSRKGPRRVNAGPHSRGLQSTHRNSSKQNIWSSLTGPSEQDMLALLFVRDQWQFARDITFPSRTSLADNAKGDPYAVLSKLGVTADELRREATEGWDWYREDIGRRFRNLQGLQDIDHNNAQKHIALTTGPTSTTIMGPTDRQQAYHLRHLEAIDLGMAWKTENLSPNHSPTDSNSNTLNNSATHTAESTEAPHSTPSNCRREGWLLNIGSKVQCLAWAPDLGGHETQYLALSTSCSSAQRESVAESEDKRAPAFRPSAPYPSSIQMWAFKCESTGEGLKRLHMAAKPSLNQVLCTDWGNIRQLQWCPVPRELRDGQEEHGTYLGLLGVLASDGHIRVLDVSVRQSLETDIEYRHVRSAAFDTISSRSLYTCFSFISPTDLLCGTSDGSLNLLNILPQQSLSQPTIWQSSQIPYLTTQQSATYMLCVSPAYPSVFPSLVASISMSGNPVLTDLRDPLKDRVVGKVARLGSKHLVYSPQLRCYICTSEGDDIYAYPVRRFFNGIRIGRYPEQGTVTTVATSPWHPCLVMGTSKGVVSCTNMLRRILPSVKRPCRRDVWVQKLCEYRWRPNGSRDDKIPDCIPPPPLSSPNDEANNTKPHPAPSPTTHQNQHQPKPQPFYGPDTRPGTSRFYDCFQPERQSTDTTTTTTTAPKPKPKPKPKTKPTGFTTPSTRAPHNNTSTHNKGRGARRLATPSRGTETLYEEEQAVTATAWNPNPACAGLLAIGWGSGIVRVEDVGHEG